MDSHKEGDNSRVKQAAETLKKHFGFSRFRDGQEDIITTVLSGGDVMVVMPTGSGKSLCYQLPALILPGTTLVISPLIALMKDQVDALTQRGISATFINSSLSSQEMRERTTGFERGEYQLVYVAPERFRNEGFMRMLTRLPPVLIAIDEAHCVSQWGHDFRPDYLQIRSIVRQFPRARLMALTATATPHVRGDILKFAGFAEPGRAAPRVFVQGFARPNLIISVHRCGGHDAKRHRLLDAIEKHRTGIVYCATRKNVEKVHELLKLEKVNAGMYHGGMSDSEREETQNRYFAKKFSVVVATNAFGMGVDRDDVRCIVHWDLPGSVEAYYQEIGRAGRDGDDAWCELLYNYADVRTHEFFLEGANPLPETVRELWRKVKSACSHGPVLRSATEWTMKLTTTTNEMAVRTSLYILERAGLVRRETDPSSRDSMIDLVAGGDENQLKTQIEGMEVKRRLDRARLDAMLSYINSTVCRHHHILDYFGDDHERSVCSGCDNCLRHTTPRKTRSPTEEEWEGIQKILSGIARLDGRFGRARIAQILAGSRAKPVVEAGLDKHRAHGLLAQWKEPRIRSMIEELIREGAVRVADGEYPLLSITDAGREMAWRRVTPRLTIEEPASIPFQSMAGPDASPGAPDEEELFQALRAWRSLTSRHRGTPAYTICADRTLRAIASARPTTPELLSTIWGMGPDKVKTYGQEIIDIVQKFDADA